jgi:hypothetical protein
MFGVPISIRKAAESARAAATRVLSDPFLYSVLVDLEKTESVLQPVKLHFGFQQLQRWPIIGDRLKVCWMVGCCLRK